MWRRKVFCAISYHICLRKQIFTKLTFCQISLPPCFGLIRESYVGSAALESHPSPPTDKYNFHQLRKVLAALLSAFGGFTLWLMLCFDDAWCSSWCTCTMLPPLQLRRCNSSVYPSRLCDGFWRGHFRWRTQDMGQSLLKVYDRTI